MKDTRTQGNSWTQEQWDLVILAETLSLLSNTNNILSKHWWKEGRRVERVTHRQSERHIQTDRQGGANSVELFDICFPKQTFFFYFGSKANTQFMDGLKLDTFIKCRIYQFWLTTPDKITANEEFWEKMNLQVLNKIWRYRTCKLFSISWLKPGRLHTLVVLKKRPEKMFLSYLPWPVTWVHRPPVQVSL